MCTGASRSPVIARQNLNTIRPKTPDTNTPYGKAWYRGARLKMGMRLKAERAKIHVKPMPSPWEGDLLVEMKLWGWKDESDKQEVDEECDFDYMHGLSRAFKGLGISAESHGNSGPNKCYQVIYRDGPAVIRGPPPANKLPPGPPKENPCEDSMHTGPGNMVHSSKSRGLKLRKDGRKLIREHVFYAKL